MPPTGPPGDMSRSHDPPTTRADERSRPPPPPEAGSAGPVPAQPRSVEPVRLQLPADPVSASVARDRLRRWLDALGWPPAQSEDIVLAVSEAVSNSVEHAYLGHRDDQPAGEVDVHVRATTEAGLRHITAVVRDHGRWRPVPADDEYRRRGIPLMRACMDRVAITPLRNDDGEHAGTLVTLRSRPVPALTLASSARPRRVEHYHDATAPPATRVAPAVFAVTRDPTGRVLLVRRADTGNWEPPGGHVQVGESTATALVREVTEETGVIVEILAVAGVVCDPDHVLAYPEHGEVLQQFAVYFHAVADHGHPRPDGDETSAAAWFAADQLDTLSIHPGVRARLDAILADPAAALIH
jgi:8-oxo-dGTP diphosphatase